VASKVFPNNALKREVLSLKIKCDQHGKGCEWVGELRNRNEHSVHCEYIDEECSNMCGEMVIRKAMTVHKEKQCQRRKASCGNCGLSMEWKKLPDHYKKCHMYPVNCIHCGELLARYRMVQHTGRQGTCSKSSLSCDFEEIGCQFRGTRKELAKHMEANAVSHLSLMAVELAATKRKLGETERKLAIIESRRALRLPTAAPSPFIYTWKIENWSQKILEAKAGQITFIDSGPFYIPPGYHFYIGAYPNGDTEDAASNLSVCLHSTEGDFDDSVKWPFPFSFVFEVVDQQSDGKNISAELSPPYRPALQSPTTKTGLGIGKMVSHETLETQCYIKADAIVVRLTVHVKRLG
jgi:hypothetical protein